MAKVFVKGKDGDLQEDQNEVSYFGTSVTKHFSPVHPLRIAVKIPVSDHKTSDVKGRGLDSLPDPQASCVVVALCLL